MKLRPFVILAVIAAVLAEITLAGLAAASHPRALVEFVASHKLGRKVTIGEMKVSFHPLVVDMDDIHVANAPWGSAPDMLSARHVTFEPYLRPLWHLAFRHVAIDGATLLLERDQNGIGNWKKGGKATKPRTPEAEAAHSRGHFPTMLDLAVHDSGVVMHTSGGNTLKIDFHDLRLQAADEKAPVTLKIDGGYNGTGVRMDINTGSFAALHAVHDPFPAEIAAEGGTAKVDAKLQLMDPVNFDQFRGTLHLRAGEAGSAAALFGAGLHWDVPLAMESGFTRDGDHWAFADAAGELAGNVYHESHIRLDEGARKEPDAIEAALHFVKLDIDALTKGTAKTQQETTLEASDTPSVLLDALLTAGKLIYGNVAASELRLHAGIARGSNTLELLSMTLWDSPMHASLTAKREGEHTTIAAKAELPRADMQEALRSLKMDAGSLSGRANARFSVIAQGSTFEQWLRSTQGSFRLSLTDGEISRHFMRIASADLRTFLGSDHERIEVPCMAAFVNFSRGTGELSPFLMDTKEGTLLGAGRVSLPERHLDLLFQADSRTTSKLAFNVPVHIAGSFSNPHIVPSATKVAKLANPNTTCFAMVRRIP